MFVLCAWICLGSCAGQNNTCYWQIAFDNEGKVLDTISYTKSHLDGSKTLTYFLNKEPTTVEYFNVSGRITSRTEYLKTDTINTHFIAYSRSNAKGSYTVVNKDTLYRSCFRTSDNHDTTVESLYDYLSDSLLSKRLEIIVHDSSEIKFEGLFKDGLNIYVEFKIIGKNGQEKGGYSKESVFREYEYINSYDSKGKLEKYSFTNWNLQNGKSTSGFVLLKYVDCPKI